MGNLAINRKMRAGPNYDLVTGTNLLDSNEVAALWLYIKKGKPKIAVPEPPCTPLGSFGSCNKWAHYDSWLASYKECAPVGRLCGQIAIHQLQQDLDYRAEQPDPSTLFHEPPWPTVAAHPRNIGQIMNQCKTGQCNAMGELLQKRTQFWASDFELSYPLQGLMCSEEHRAKFKHGIVQGAATKPAQVYTYDLCNRLTLGMQRLLQCKYQRMRGQPAKMLALPVTTPPPPIPVGRRRRAAPTPEPSSSSSAALSSFSPRS